MNILFFYRVKGWKRWREEGDENHPFQLRLIRFDHGESMVEIWARNLGGGNFVWFAWNFSWARVVTGAADEQILQRAARLAYLSFACHLLGESPDGWNVAIHRPIIVDQTAEMWPTYLSRIQRYHFISRSLLIVERRCFIDTDKRGENFSWHRRDALVN